MKKVKTRKLSKQYETNNAVIVQLLGGNKKNKAKLRKELFTLANSLDMNIIVRVVGEADMTKNFEYIDLFK